MLLAGPNVLMQQSRNEPRVARVEHAVPRVSKYCRAGEVQGGQRHIDRAEFSRYYLFIVSISVVRSIVNGNDESVLFEKSVQQRVACSVIEMNKDILDNREIPFWEFLWRRRHFTKAQTLTLMLVPICFDDLWNKVVPDIFNRAYINTLHQLKISTADVDDSPHIVVPDEGFEKNDVRSVDLRNRPRTRTIAPSIVTIDR